LILTYVDSFTYRWDVTYATVQTLLKMPNVKLDFGLKTVKSWTGQTIRLIGCTSKSEL
jgi:hypothetical protein